MDWHSIRVAHLSLEPTGAAWGLGATGRLGADCSSCYSCYIVSAALLRLQHYLQFSSIILSIIGWYDRLVWNPFLHFMNG